MRSVADFYQDLPGRRSRVPPLGVKRRRSELRCSRRTCRRLQPSGRRPVHVRRGAPCACATVRATLETPVTLPSPKGDPRRGPSTPPSCRLPRSVSRQRAQPWPWFPSKFTDRGSLRCALRAAPITERTSAAAPGRRAGRDVNCAPGTRIRRAPIAAWAVTTCSFCDARIIISISDRSSNPAAGAPAPSSAPTATAVLTPAAEAPRRRRPRRARPACGTIEDQLVRADLDDRRHLVRQRRRRPRIPAPSVPSVRRVAAWPGHIMGVGCRRWRR